VSALQPSTSIDAGGWEDHDGGVRFATKLTISKLAPVKPPPLSLFGWRVGPLTCGAQLSAAVALGFCFILFQKNVQTCKIHILSFRTPNWVVQIGLLSWWCLVFIKNIKCAMFYSKLFIGYLFCLFLNKLRKFITWVWCMLKMWFHLGWYCFLVSYLGKC
jgi:hypothetical protein